VKENFEAAKLLEEFTTYCREHPQERFWQALRNWCGHNFLLVSGTKAADDLQDTFYWKGRSDKGDAPLYPPIDPWLRG
jgi:hypothetical protein